MGELIFYVGGAKSGKTRRALAKAETWSAPRIYLATAEALDDEMVVRVKRHQAERGEGWKTLEAPFEPDVALAGLTGQSPVLMDCLTLWLSNLLRDHEEPEEAMSWTAKRVEQLLAAIGAYGGPVIVVSNEVGGGIVPMNALARLFRDIAGAANQRLAERADQVYYTVAGLELQLK